MVSMLNDLGITVTFSEPLHALLYQLYVWANIGRFSLCTNVLSTNIHWSAFRLLASAPIWDAEKAFRVESSSSWVGDNKCFASPKAFIYLGRATHKEKSIKRRQQNLGQQKLQLFNVFLYSGSWHTKVCLKLFNFSHISLEA